MPLILGASILMLGPERDNAYGAEGGPNDGQRTDAIYVAVVPDVGKAFAGATAVGAEITTEPRETLDGSREFAVRFPEDILWSVGSN